MGVFPEQGRVSRSQSKGLAGAWLVFEQVSKACGEGGRPVGTQVQPSSTRPLEAAWIGGVCAGLAAQLGWSVIAVRLAFVALGTVSLLGVVVYFVLWLAMPPQDLPGMAPGLESHSRTGLRPVQHRRLQVVDLPALFAFVLVGAGGLWLVEGIGWGLPPEWLLVGLFVAAGWGLMWWQADRVSGSSFRPRSGWRQTLRTAVRGGSSVVVMVLGVVAIVAAAVLASAMIPEMTALAQLVVIVLFSLILLIVAVLPWLVRGRRGRRQRRQDALLADARADIAAHLHDSVLQTLALIQRQAADPKKVAALARRQERELRQWLYGEAPPLGSLMEAITQDMLDVEVVHGVDVELVSVGDVELNAELEAVVRATREAMVNAAKHSGADRVDVYAEVDDFLVSVYVRDRGVGFDLNDIEQDRMGVRGSITERIRRVGGRAIIKTAPGEGTEVRLEVPR